MSSFRTSFSHFSSSSFFLVFLVISVLCLSTRVSGLISIREAQRSGTPSAVGPLSTGDVLVVALTSPTDRGGQSPSTALSKAVVDSLVVMNFTQSATLDYIGEWLDDARLRVVFTDVSTNGVDVATVSMTSTVMDPTQTNSVSQSPALLSGSFDSSPPVPALQSIEGHPGKDGANGYGPGDRIVVTLTEPAAHTVDVSTSNSNATDPLLYLGGATPVGQSLGNFTLTWKSYREIQFEFTSTPNISDGSTVLQFGNGTVLESLTPGTFSSPLSATRVLSSPTPPTLTSCVARNGEETEGGPEPGDTITFTFDLPTNGQDLGQVSTTVIVNCTSNCGSASMSSALAMHTFIDDRTMELSFEGVPDFNIGAVFTVNFGGAYVRNEDETSDAIASSCTLEGSFSPATTPTVTSFAAVNGALKQRINVGDYFEITFSEATNMGGAGIGQMLDQTWVGNFWSFHGGAVGNKQSTLGTLHTPSVTNFSAQWQDASMLRIFFVGVSLDAVMEIGAAGLFSIKAEAGLYNAAGTSSQVMGALPALTGGFGAISQSVHAELESVDFTMTEVTVGHSSTAVQIILSVRLETAAGHDWNDTTAVMPAFGQCRFDGTGCDRFSWVMVEGYTGSTLISHQIGFRTSAGAVLTGATPTANGDILINMAAHLHIHTATPETVLSFTKVAMLTALTSSTTTNVITNTPSLVVKRAHEAPEPDTEPPSIAAVLSGPKPAFVRKSPSDPALQLFTLNITVSDQGMGLDLNNIMPSSTSAEVSGLITKWAWQAVPLHEFSPLASSVTITNVTFFSGDSWSASILVEFNIQEYFSDTVNDAGMHFITQAISIRDSVGLVSELSVSDLLQGAFNSNPSALAVAYGHVDPTNSTDSSQPSILYTKMHVPAVSVLDDKPIELKVDITALQQTVALELVVADPESGIDAIQVLMGGSAMEWFFRAADVTHGDSKLGRFYSNITLPVGSLPTDDYTIDTVRVNNTAGIVFTSTGAASSTWDPVAPAFDAPPFELHVRNQLPTVTTVAFTTNSSLDVSSTSKTVNLFVQLHAGQALPFASESLVYTYYGPAGGSSNGAQRYSAVLRASDIVSGNRTHPDSNGAYTVGLSVPVSIPHQAHDGDWVVSEILFGNPTKVDGDNQGRFLRTGELGNIYATTGSNGRVSVTSSPSDVFVPTLANFSVLVNGESELNNAQELWANVDLMTLYADALDCVNVDNAQEFACGDGSVLGPIIYHGVSGSTVGWTMSPVSGTKHKATSHAPNYPAFVGKVVTFMSATLTDPRGNTGSRTMSYNSYVPLETEIAERDDLCPDSCGSEGTCRKLKWSSADLETDPPVTQVFYGNQDALFGTGYRCECRSSITLPASPCCGPHGVECDEQTFTLSDSKPPSLKSIEFEATSLDLSDVGEAFFAPVNLRIGLADDPDNSGGAEYPRGPSIGQCYGGSRGCDPGMELRLYGRGHDVFIEKRYQLSEADGSLVFDHFDESTQLVYVNATINIIKSTPDLTFKVGFFVGFDRASNPTYYHESMEHDFVSGGGVLNELEVFGSEEPDVEAPELILDDPDLYPITSSVPDVMSGSNDITAQLNMSVRELGGGQISDIEISFVLFNDASDGTGTPWVVSQQSVAFNSSDDVETYSFDVTFPLSGLSSAGKMAVAWRINEIRLVDDTGNSRQYDFVSLATRLGGGEARWTWMRWTLDGRVPDSAYPDAPEIVYLEFGLDETELRNHATNEFNDRPERFEDRHSVVVDKFSKVSGNTTVKIFAVVFEPYSGAASLELVLTGNDNTTDEISLTESLGGNLIPVVFDVPIDHDSFPPVQTYLLDNTDARISLYGNTGSSSSYTSASNWNSILPFKNGDTLQGARIVLRAGPGFYNFEWTPPSVNVTDESKTLQLSVDVVITEGTLPSEGGDDFAELDIGPFSRFWLNDYEEQPSGRYPISLSGDNLVGSLAADNKSGTYATTVVVQRNSVDGDWVVISGDFQLDGIHLEDQDKVGMPFNDLDHSFSVVSLNPDNTPPVIANLSLSLRRQNLTLEPADGEIVHVLRGADTLVLEFDAFDPCSNENGSIPCSDIYVGHMRIELDSAYRNEELEARTAVENGFHSGWTPINGSNARHYSIPIRFGYGNDSEEHRRDYHSEGEYKFVTILLEDDTGNMLYLTDIDLPVINVSTPATEPDSSQCSCNSTDGLCVIDSFGEAICACNGDSVCCNSNADSLPECADDGDDGDGGPPEDECSSLYNDDATALLETCAAEFDPEQPFPRLNQSRYREICNSTCLSSGVVAISAWLHCLDENQIGGIIHDFVGKVDANLEYSCVFNEIDPRNADESDPGNRTYCRGLTDQYFVDNLDALNSTEAENFNISCPFMDEIDCCVGSWYESATAPLSDEPDWLPAMILRSHAVCKGESEPSDPGALTFCKSALSEFDLCDDQYAGLLDDALACAPEYNATSWSLTTTQDYKNFCTRPCLKDTVRPLGHAYRTCLENAVGVEGYFDEERYGSLIAVLQQDDYTCLTDAGVSPDFYCRRETDEYAASVLPGLQEGEFISCSFLSSIGCCAREWREAADAGLYPETLADLIDSSVNNCSEVHYCTPTVDPFAECDRDIETEVMNCVPEFNASSWPLLDYAGYAELCGRECRTSLTLNLDSYVTCLWDVSAASQVALDASRYAFLFRAHAENQYTCKQNDAEDVPSYCRQRTEDFVRNDLPQFNETDRIGCDFMSELGCCAVEWDIIVSTTAVPASSTLRAIVQPSAIDCGVLNGTGEPQIARCAQVPAPRFSPECYAEFSAYTASQVCLSLPVFSSSKFDEDDLDGLCTSACFAHVHNNASAWLSCEQSVSGAVHDDDARADVRFLEYTCSRSPERGYCRRDAVTGSFFNFANEASAPLGAVSLRHAHLHCDALEQAGCCYNAFFDMASALGVSGEIDSSCTYLSSSPCSSTEPDIVRASSACIADFSAFKTAASNCLPEDFLRVPRNESALDSLCKDACYASLYGASETWLACETQQTPALTTYAKSAVAMFKYACSANSETGNYCLNELHQVINFPSQHDLVLDLQLNSSTSCASFTGAGCCAAELREFVSTTPINDAYLQTVESCGLPTEPCSSGGFGYSSGCQTDFESFDSIVECLPEDLLNRTRSGSELATLCGSVCYADAFSAASRWLQCENNATEGVLTPVTGFVQYLTFLCEQNSTGAYCAATDVLGTMATYPDAGASDSDPVTDFKLNSSADCGQFEATGCCPGTFISYALETPDGSAAAGLYTSCGLSFTPCTTSGGGGSSGSSGGTSGGDEVLTASSACQSYLDSYHGMESCFSTDFLYSSYDDTTLAAFCASSCFFSIETLAQDWLSCEHTNPSGVSADVEAVVQYLSFLCSSDSSGNWCASDSVAGTFIGFDQVKNPRLADVYIPDCTSFNDTGCCGTEWVDLVLATDSHSSVSLMQQQCAAEGIPVLSGDGCDGATSGGGGSGSSDEEYSLECASVAGQFNNATDCFGTVLSVPLNQSYLTDFCASSCYSNLVSIVQGWLACEESNQNGILGPVEGYEAYLNYLCSQNEQDQFCARQSLTGKLNMYGEGGPLYGLELDAQTLTCSNVNSTGCCASHWDDYVSSTDQSSALDLFISDCTTQGVDLELNAPCDDGSGGGEPRSSPACASFVDLFSDQVDIFGENVLETADSAVFETGCNAPTYLYLMGNLTLWEECELAQGSSGLPYYAHGYYKLMYYMCSRNNNGDWCFDRSETGNFTIFDAQSEPLTTAQIEPTVSCLDYTKTGCCFQEWMTMVSATGASSAAIANTADCSFLPTDHCPVHYGGDGGDDDGLAPSAGCVAVANTFRNVSDCLPSDVWSVTSSSSLEQHCGGTCYTESLQAAQNWLGCEQDNLEGRVKSPNTFISALTLLCSRDDTGDFCMPKVATLATIKSGDDFPGVTLGQQSCSELHSAGCCVHPWSDFIGLTAADTQMQAWLGTCDAEVAPDAACGTQREWSYSCTSLYESAKLALNCLPQNRSELLDTSALSQLCDGSCYTGAFEAVKEWASCEAGLGSASDASVSSLTGFLELICSKDTDGEYCLSSTLVGNMVVFPDGAADRPDDNVGVDVSGLTDCASVEAPGCCMADLLEYGAAMFKGALTEHVTQLTCSNVPSTVCADVFVRQPWPEDRAFGSRYGQCSSNAAFAFDAMSRFCGMDSFPDGPRAWFELDETTLRDVCLPGCVAAFGDELDNWIDCLTDPVRSASIEDLRLTDSAAYNASADMYMARRMRSQLLFQCTGDVDDPSPDGGYCMSNLALDIFDSERPDPFADILSCFEASTSNSRDKRAACPTLSDSFSCSTFGNAAFFCCVGSFAQRVVGEDRALEVSRVLPEAGTSLFSTYINSLIRTRCSSVVPATYDITKFTDDACPTPSTGGSSSACVSDFYDLLSAAHTCLGSDVLAAVSTGADVSEVARLDDLQLTEICKCGEAVYDRATEVQQCVSNNPGALEQFDLSGTRYNGDGEPAALEEIKGAIGTVCRVQPSSSNEPDAFCVDLLYNVNVSVSDEGSLSLAPEDEACVAYNAMGCCRASFLDWTNEVSGVTALLNEMQSNCDVGGTVGECAELFEPRQACRASLATVASTASSCGLHGLFAGNSVSLSNLNASGLAEACAESNRACLASLSVAADNAATCVRQYVGLSDDLTDEVEETLVLLAESASSPDLFCGAEVIGDVTNVQDRGFCALKLAALVESTTSTGGTTGAGTQGTSTSVDPVATLCSAIQAMGCCAVNYAASNASDETTEDLKLFCARYNLPNLDQPSCGVVGKPVVLRVPQVSVLRLVTNPPSIIVQFDALTNQQFAVLDSAGVDAIVKAAAGESIGSRYSGRWTTPAVLQIFVGDPTPTEGTTLITEGSKLTIKATANIRDQTGESDAVSGETPAAVGELALPVVEEPIPDPPQVKSAVWNTDFRTFIIYFDSSTNGLDSFQPFVSCESVLDSTTVSLVSTRADCIWAAPAQLFVRLPSSVSIPLSSTVGVRSGVILATGGESDPATVNLTTTLSLPAGVDTSVSRASVVCPSSVSACGNIVCTASALGSLGSSFSYNWTLASASPALSLEDETALETYLSTMTSLNVQRISVPVTLIEAGTTYVLQMRVTNVAGSSQTVTSTVVVAAQSLPEIRLSGEQRVTWPVTRTNRAGTVVRFEVCGQTITTSQSFNLLSVSWQQLTTLTAEQSTATGLVTADISPDLISLPSSVLQSSTLLVPPFTPLFVPGRTYVFEATVSARLPDADAGDAPLTNSVLLVVDTPEVPLQPIVRPSGTVRVSLAFAGSSFELDGSFSYDPALARGDQVALTYQWSCERAGVVCSLPGVDLTQSTLSVPVATLEPTTASTLYEFALTVSSSTRSSTSRVTQLAVDLASAPLVTILASPSSLSSGRPLAVNQRLILQGLASSAGVFLRPGVASTTFAWSVSSNNLDLTASGVALTSVNSPVLVIRRNQLAAGTTYTFKLTVATPTADAAGVGEISITTAGVPSGGVCRAVLGYTEAGEAITHEDATAEVLQQIDLECEGWQSDTSTLPLSYQFRQVDEEDGALQRLSVLAARNSISVRLGTNDLESTTNVTISVLIANTAGGLAEYQFAVGVSPPQLDNETDVTDYALEQLGQFESEIDATGNPETVYNAAHSICDLIDASRNGKHLKRRKALGLPIDADSLRQHGLLSLSLKSDGEPTDEALEELRRVRQRVFEILQSFDERAGSLWTLETVLDQLSIVLKIVTQPDELSREFRVNLTRFALTKLTQSAQELPRTDTDEVVELDATVDQDPLSYVQGVLDAVDAAVRSVLDELADVSDDERAEAEAEAQELSDLYDEFVYTVSRFIGLRQPVGDSSATAASRAGTFFLLVQRNYGDELGGAEVEDADGTTVLTVPAGFNPLELNGEDASGEVFFTVTSATYDPFAWATNPTDSSDDDVLQPGEEGEVTPFALESNVVSVEFTRPVETGDGGQNLTVSDLTQELQIVIEHAALPPVEADGTEVRPVCVFWDETAERWSTEGCRVSSYTETHTTCLCNHLTQFKSEASQFTPTVQSVSSEDFLALSWSNLMEHPTTLISITVACLLFCLLFPFAHRVDLKARIKYAEIRRRNKERREDKGGGILPPAASHRGMRDPQDESESEMDSDNSGVQLQQNGSSVEDMSQMQSRRDSVGSVVSDAPRALPSQAGQRSYDASIEMSSMSQVDLRVLQAAENGNGDGMHGSSSKPVSVNFAGRTDSGDEGEPGEPGASAARQMSVSASGESVMLANEVLPSGASAPNATKKRGRGKTLLQGGWRDNLLVYRMVTSFRHRHLWLSVAFRHPRDPVNSKQRLACLLGLVLGNLAVNAAFYGSAHLFADITVALISSIAVLPTTVFLMFLFRGGTCTSARVPKQYLGTRYRHPSALCPRRGKMLGWLFWFVWCSGCMLMALVYGLQFDLNEDERESDDQGFLNTGVDSLTGRWLVSCGIGMAFDFCLSRPAIITLRTVTAHSCPNRCGSLL